MPSSPPVNVWMDFPRARRLAEIRATRLLSETTLTRKSYSTENYTKQLDSWVGDGHDTKVRLNDRCHLVERPSDDLRQMVGELYGLRTVSESELVSKSIGQEVQVALNVLGHCQSMLSIVSSVVWCVVIIESDSPDTDVSYSDPQVPFSIYVSVPPKESQADTLRLAESILHESMHLYLTLIEQEEPMVRSSSNSLMAYSPWRDCLRPLNGVLHGAFVFRAIKDFFTRLRTVHLSPAEHNHIRSRLQQIEDDFGSLQLRDFRDELTPFGTDLLDEIESDSRKQLG